MCGNVNAVYEKISVGGMRDLMRMNRFKMMIAFMMAVIIMIPAIRVSATEGGYGGHSSSNGTSTTASGETMYGKAAAEGGGTGTTADLESVVDKTMAPEAVSTPTVENPVSESDTEPEPESDEPEQIPENNENQVNAIQLPESTMADQDMNNAADPDQTATVQIPEREIIAGFESKIPGVYQANSVEGCAVITEAEEIKRNYGLTAEEEAYARFLDLDESKYPVSSQMLSLAADSQGAAVCARLKLELGKMAGGDYSLLPSGGAAIRIVLGIPSGFLDEGRIYAVACVRKDGTVTILTDQDETPGTITIDVAGGAGTYAIIRY